MIGIVLLWCLAQSPGSSAAPVAVVISSKRPGADAFATTTASRLHAALLREGLRETDALDDAATGLKVRAAGFSDPRNCQGGASCLARLAVLLGPNAVVVGVDVGKIGGQLAIRLEGVSAKTGKSLLVTDVSAPVEGWGDTVAVPIALFARELLGKLPALAPAPEPPPKIAPDAPRVDLLPPPPAPPPEVTRASRPSAVKWALGAGTLVVGGVSVGFLAAGLGARSQLHSKDTVTADGAPATGFTAAEARQLSSSANLQLSVSLATGVVAAVLLAAAMYFFLSE